MVAEADLRRRIGLEIGREGVRSAARRRRSTKSRTGRGPRRRGLYSAGVGARSGVEGVFELGAEILGQRAGVGLQLLRGPVRLLFARRPLGKAGGSVSGAGEGEIVGAFEQRVALELVLDVGGEFDIGQLQKLDRLQELRRHHHRLALTHHQFCRQSHCSLLTHAERTLLAQYCAARFLLVAQSARLIDLACDAAPVKAGQRLIRRRARTPGAEMAPASAGEPPWRATVAACAADRRRKACCRAPARGPPPPNPRRDRFQDDASMPRSRRGLLVPARLDTRRRNCLGAARNDDQ